MTKTKRRRSTDTAADPVFRTVEQAIESAVEHFGGEARVHPLTAWPADRRMEAIEGGASLRAFRLGGGYYVFGGDDLAAVVRPLAEKDRA
jgi:hypothetical protein